MISGNDHLDVLWLYLIPMGGGIPAGVLLADSRAIGWPMMSFLYFVSDIILACLFEPVLLGLFFWAKKSNFLRKLAQAYKDSLAQTGFKYPVAPGPLALILISFGVEPMTGRAAAKSAGYGFFAGWAVAICGDMMYFAIIMASTLWLNHLLGDGTWAVVMVLVGMILIPMTIRKWKERR